MSLKLGVRENHIEIFKKSGKVFSKKISETWATFTVNLLL